MESGEDAQRASRGVTRSPALAAILVAPFIGALCVSAIAEAQPRSTIEGVVFDSIALRPMAGAVVQLVRVNEIGRPIDTRSAGSDSAGRFAFDEVLEATYLLGFQHLSIDSLGFRAPIHRVDVRRTGVMRVVLTVPSMSSIVHKVCGPASAKDSASLLVGSVRNARTDAPVADAYVSIKWSEVVLTRTGSMHRAMPTHDLRTNDEGWYTACVPSGVPVTAHAENDALRSGDVEVTLSTLGVLRRDLYIGEAERVIVGADDSVRTSGAVGEGDRILARGAGMLRGVVRALDGTLLGGARVAMVGGSGETRSDTEGRFQLTGLPEGTHTIEARLLGYLPEQTMVDVVAFRESTAAIEMVDLRSRLLDTVRVRAMRELEARAKEGFERRRRAGTGIFIDESVIDTMRVTSFSDLVRGVPGIRLADGQGQFERFESQVEFLRGRGAPCPPEIFLDGVRLVRGFTDLDQFLSVRSIRRLEIYPRGSLPPAEFAASGVNCGILAIWTGTPPLRPVRPDTSTVKKP